MRFLFAALVTLSTSLAVASEKFNHITCEYQQNESEWEFAAVDYNRDGFELSSGDSAAGVAAWTSSRAVNTGFCIALVGTNDTSTIESVLYVFEGTEIWGVDLKTCQPQGADISIVKKETQLTPRGSVVDMSVDNWYDQGAPLLRMKHYIPLVSENDRVTELAVTKCEEFRP
ncbi:hypothetical protein ACLSU7_13410 [Bdellovibrio sp. HCB185ZH]|uniref:hypothetical protein n=1 Tax=Bdellovibrio sp. HCB185ZH TaxID=3394235 RepID=UPI0039A75093